jgi:hypothetical protein
MERGRVLRFSAVDRYGFLETSSGERLFFHANDGQFIYAGDVRPEFVGHVIVRECVGRFVPDPQPGDELVFQRSAPSGPLPKAMPWGYARFAERAQKRLKRRGPPRRYRLRMSFRKRSTEVFGPYGTFWEGSNVLDIARQFPREGDIWRFLNRRAW